MKVHKPSPASSSAFTLLEMTIVLMIILGLLGIGTYSAGKVSEWRKGREAGEVLRSVYTAQRLYLADHPTTPVANITAADLVPYMRSSATSLPTVESLEGTQLTIKVNVSPPVVDGGGGTTYDPSGKPTDSLWDVGQ